MLTGRGVAGARGAPLVDGRAVSNARRAEREDGWRELHRHPGLLVHPTLSGWLERERSTGAVMRGVGDPFVVLREALALLMALPAEPPQTLARFAAARCGGDPHALDRDRPLDAVLRRALAGLDGEPGADTAGAEARRARYDRWGLGCDELSSTVLCAGLRPCEVGSSLSAALRASASAGEPRVVTLRELRGIELLACGPIVWTCENPDVVAAAADALGPACPPLICTGGWPSTACLRLVRAIGASGAELRHHGDFDVEGLRILDRVLSVTEGQLWRMTPRIMRATPGLARRFAPTPRVPACATSGWHGSLGTFSATAERCARSRRWSSSKKICAPPPIHPVVERGLAARVD